jgi:PAS domain S-box-containing protein
MPFPNQIPDLPETRRQKVAQIWMFVCLIASMLAVLSSGLIICNQLTGAKIIIDSVTFRESVLHKLGSALASTKDAESAQRGFLLTGNNTYFEAYTKALNRIAEQMSELDKLAEKDYTQKIFLINVAVPLRQKLVALQQTIKLYRTKGFEAAIADLKNDSGKTFMISLRADFEAAAADEREEISNSSALLQSVSRSIVLNFACLVILALILSGAFAFLVRRYVVATSRLQQFLIERAAFQEEQAELLELTYDAIMVRNLADGTIRYWNKGAQQLYGFSAEEAIGRKSHELLKTQFPTALEEIEKEAPAVGHWEGELIQTTKDDRKLTVASRWRFKADQAGHLSSILDTDITERKLADLTILRDKELRLSELEKSNEELQQFAYACSHDLQEPLRVISNFSQLLSNRYKGKLDDKADHFIGFIVDGAKRMTALINDLLILSRVQTQGQEATDVDCAEAVELARKNLLLAIEETGATINCGKLPMIQGDPLQFMQLFQNLLGNALKFRSDKPPVIDIKANLLGDKWEFAVSDNGLGLDMHFADRIFVIFQRLHTSATHAGSGLGLALCKKIVQRHGGRIWVESEVGLGTTFFFTVPANISVKAS